MRILITGGAGFIGSHVAEAYLEAGHHVAAVDALVGGRRSEAPPGVVNYEVDIRSPQLAQVFQDERPDVVSHHAAQANLRRSIADPILDAETNVLGTLRVLDLSVHYHVSQVIFSSTAGALYGEPDRLPATEDAPVRPTSPYGLHKYLGEQYFEYYRRVRGLNTAVLRYANVYGPRQAVELEAGVVALFTEAFLEGRSPTVFGDGTQVRDFVYVGDVARANLDVLGRHLDEPVHISTGVGTTVNELASRLRHLTGSSVAPHHEPAIAGEVHRIVLDPSRAQRLLGWRASVQLEEGLRRTVEWFRERRSVRARARGRGRGMSGGSDG